MKSVLNGRQFAFLTIAAVAFLAGVAVYAVDRPVGSTRIWPSEFQLGIGHEGLLAPLLGSLPSFLHIYAFILATAALTRLRRENLWIVCVAWLAVEVLFEVVQSPPDVSAGAFLSLSRLLGTGVFDPYDIAALAVGAAAAYLTILWPGIRRKGERACK